ncbi:hypothetical protein J5N97_026182 [Dioscorea zingiberensis]|uniref:Bromo domain-containing protein n=1 Tax=Dioscorea zingiberensis TaxID=325984 RepID=A0A9D5H697_9LILI|nr:hypothetical protein J5N97_026182 [Dioscorea zingiberensis]
MARSRDLDEGEEEIWGTWEELLLACAVGRHGTRRWDSVATEVQSRMTPSSALLLTPFRCRQRFNLLQLRFSTAVATDGGAGSRVEVLLIEELRKLRIAELRREVDRSDHSIVSLKLKLKNLKEDGEQNLRESEPGGSDPETDQDLKPESPGSTEEAVAEDRVSKGSSKESNSTDPKGNGNAGKLEGVARNTECTAVVGKRETEPEERDQGLAEPRESGESAAELKRGDAEETSEGRTSSSHARQHRRRRRKVPLASSSGGGGGGGEEPEADVISHRTGTTSQPFIAFLEIIRASTSGSVFERRLESQESEEYRNLIRCHVDLEMISEKIQRLGAAYTRTDFFRDLLLLCNNAIVFYAMDSNESIAAVHLRGQISKEMAATHHQASTQPPPPPLPLVAEKIKADPHLAGPLFEKSESTIPLIACRKRSSISAKKADPDPDPKVKRKDKPGPEPVPEPDPNPKKKMKELPTPAPSRGLRTSKSRSLNRSRRSHPSSNLKTEMAEPEPEPEPEPEAKPERKNSSSAASSASAKKRGGPANLLKRIKRTPADNEKVSPPSSAVCSDRAERKKKGGKGSNGKTPKRVVKEPAPAKKVREELEAVKPSPAPRKRKRR